MAAPNSILISTSAELKIFLSSIGPGSTIYLDLEGKNLSRDGTLTLATMLIQPQNVTRVVDVLSLGESAFNIESEEETSLKSILENPAIPKSIWDARNDADALWAHFRVALAGVTDVQLLENASRPPGVDRSRLSGLYNAIRFDVKLGFQERERWIRSKDSVRNLMSQDIFSRRPLACDTIRYCVNDVVHLPALQEYYMNRITPEWLARAREESHRRVVDARSPGYQPQSPDKVFAPWGRISATNMSSMEEAFETYWGLIYYDQKEYDDSEEYDSCSEDRPSYAADAYDFDGVFDSCWDKN